MHTIQLWLVWKVICLSWNRYAIDVHVAVGVGKVLLRSIISVCKSDHFLGPSETAFKK